MKNKLTHGGARKGAGRKAASNKLILQAFRLRPDQVEFLSHLKGKNQFVRDAIDQAIATSKPKDNSK